MDKEPSKKPSREEIEDRVERARHLLATGVAKGAIKRAMQKAYGVSVRQCETYMARARALIVEATGKSVAEHRAESYAFYQTVKADPTASPLAKIRAQERIDKLLGLEMPQKITLTDPSGEEPGTIRLHATKMIETLPEDDLDRLAAAYDILDRLNGNNQN